MSADEWMTRTDDGNIVRGVEFAKYDTATAGVVVDGWEDITGQIIERKISLYDVKDSMDAVQARALSAALAAAADHLDVLTGDAPPFM